MFELLALKNRNDYFKPQNQRIARGTYCYRWVGFDEETLIFLRKIHIETQLKGLYIKKPIPNPTESEVNYFYERTDNQFKMDKEYLLENGKAWFRTTNQESMELICDAIYEMLLKLQSMGTNSNILKNAYIKFMCWGRYQFESILGAIGQQVPPKILFEGELTKYELYMLFILARSGCDVVIVNFESDEAYLKIDPSSAFSKLVYGKKTGVPSHHFSKIDIAAIERASREAEEIKHLEGTVATNTWLKGDFFDALEKNNMERCFEGSPKINNLFVIYKGIDQKEAYRNRLYRLKTKLEKKKKLFVVDEKIPNPTMEEVGKIRKFSYQEKQDMIEQMSMEIDISVDRTVVMLAKRAFLAVMQEMNQMSLFQLHNHGIRLLCWLKRFGGPMFEHYQLENLPIFLYYGAASQGEAAFMTMLSLMPIDVIYICPDKSAQDTFISLNMAKKAIIYELADSMPVESFPNAEHKMKVATTAYEAERDLDKMLYSGTTGLYRNRQFRRSTPVTLKTTQDEIGILWKEHAKYRPSFSVEENRVTVPNLFVKICGVEERSEVEYFKKIKEMITVNTIVVTRIPFMPESCSSPMRQNIRQFIKNGKILPDKIKNAPNYTYDYLSDDTQAYIFEKIQELIDLNWIKCDMPNLSETILATLLNLGKKTIRLIQQFDFTAEIPKVLIVDVDEAMLSLEDGIYLSFLNLVGFDIAVFTPTGYRNIEKYIKEDAYEEFQVGRYLYNLMVPNLGGGGQDNGGFINKIFGLGRK